MHYFDYREGELKAEGVSLSHIAEVAQTPCYVYSHSAICSAWQAFRDALTPYPHQICYAVKANSNLAVLSTLAKLGSGFDIVSGGELERVIAAGGDPRQVVFSGVGKTIAEIERALVNNIFCFNVESQAELTTLNDVAKKMNKKAPIALRVNPNIDPMSHPYISTGLKESKFGIAIDEAHALYQQAQGLSHIEIKGIACHIGSQITKLSPFIDALERLLGLHKTLKTSGIHLSHIDVGGGLGVCYENETPPTPAAYANALTALLKDCGLTLLIEPGRAIVAKAGVLVTKVLYLKESTHKNFCIVDCAMNDFMRPSLYDAWQAISPVKQGHQGEPLLYDVVGPVCESGDFLGKDRALAVKQNDLLVIHDTGAYGFAMSSNYNTRPKAAEVMVKDTTFKIVRPRELLSDLMAKEVLW
ncbi:MAG: diaminopimelate decarboxylase [Candidatus Berkiella sp.]